MIWIGGRIKSRSGVKIDAVIAWQVKRLVWLGTTEGIREALQLVHLLDSRVRYWVL
jgi:hypothetical protein